jgi:hypothetical protein
MPQQYESRKKATHSGGPYDEKVYNLANVIFKWLLLLSAVILGSKVLLKDSKGLRNSVGLFIRNPIKHSKTITNEGNFLLKKIQNFSAMVRSYFDQTKI